MKKSELVFIPTPGLSHLIPTMETAKLLLHRDGRLAATVLLLPTSSKDTNAETYIKSTASNPTFSSRLRFINLPFIQHTNTHFFEQFDVQIPNARREISNLVRQSDSRLAGVVLDIFCTEFADVAGEFGLPAYLFYTGGAVSLGLFQHLVSLKFEHGEDVTAYKDAVGVELPTPYLSLPVPAEVLPAVTVDKHFFPDIFLNHFKRVSEMRGVMINTFYELESYAVESLLSDDKTPEIYPVGPALKKETLTFDEDDDVKKWLDDQPENSVVFLCFGTAGSFDGAQVREIAEGLERSGSRFLWSLRKPATRENFELERESEYFEQVLPEGFLERTKGVGRVIGWAPQAAVLAHAAVGGFVSHCGWNSTLESVWFGVPMATFPLHAEQQLNAFYLVEELGVAEAITMDYKMDFTGENPPETVGREVIAAGIRRLMAEEGGRRRKVEEMGKKARAALVEGGSSYNAQTLFIEEVMRNIA
ncbi:UDP-glycosyltransferase 71E1-like [Salvia miltiorrhiza]|uniref:UDP-glycosyltransferase 71E1-like n=1 Tax=Salvia miltiorrhiza TaxID=226208 RepID=UPI0025ABBCED|nr:UDP-glycosyltransferase 71E1-like [Salvia miltiorrhiza]